MTCRERRPLAKWTFFGLVLVTVGEESLGFDYLLADPGCRFSRGECRVHDHNSTAQTLIGWIQRYAGAPPPHPSPPSLLTHAAPPNPNPLGLSLPLLNLLVPAPQEGYGAVERHMRELVAEGEFDQGPASDLYFRKTFYDIGSAEEFWLWMGSMEAVQQLITYPNVTFQNEILHVAGVMGLFQLRVKGQRCEAAYRDVYTAFGRGEEPTCHPGYSPENLDVTPFGLADATCALVPNATAHWTGGIDLGEFDVRGMYGRWYDFRHSFPYRIPVALYDTAKVVEGLDCLARHEWINSATRAVLLRVSVVSNPQIFSRFHFLVEINSKGWYRPSFSALSYEANARTWFWHTFLRLLALSVFGLRWLWELYEDCRFRHLYGTAWLRRCLQG